MENTLKKKVLSILKMVPPLSSYTEKGKKLQIKSKVTHKLSDTGYKSKITPMQFTWDCFLSLYLKPNMQFGII